MYPSHASSKTLIFHYFPWWLPKLAVAAWSCLAVVPKALSLTLPKWPSHEIKTDEKCYGDLCDSSGIKQLDIVLAKLMFSGKLLIRWGKIVKIIKIFEKLEHITHFGSKITVHLLCRHSISYHLHLNSLSTCNWSNIQKKNKSNHSWLWPVGFKMFQLLKYFDNFDNFTSLIVVQHKKVWL